jgi:CHAD domain-containing protein
MIECVAPRETVHRARRLLKRRLKALGELRDTHVQLLFIERRLQRYPELMLVRDFLRRKERRLEKSAAARMKAFKTRKLAKWIPAVVEHLTPDIRVEANVYLESGVARARRLEKLARALARATTRAFGEVVFRRRSINPAVAGTVHRTRTAFKKFRYMMEALSPAYTNLNKRDLRALAQYQRRMGTLQDLEVIQQCLEAFTNRNDGMDELLEQFARYLLARRAQALRSFLKTADELFNFWPPSRAKTNGHVAAHALDAA